MFVEDDDSAGLVGRDQGRQPGSDRRSPRPLPWPSRVAAAPPQDRFAAAKRSAVGVVDRGHQQEGLPRAAAGARAARDRRPERHARRRQPWNTPAAQGSTVQTSARPWGLRADRRSWAATQFAAPWPVNRPTTATQSASATTSGPGPKPDHSATEQVRYQEATRGQARQPSLQHAAVQLDPYSAADSQVDLGRVGTQEHRHGIVERPPHSGNVRQNPNNPWIRAQGRGPCADGVRAPRDPAPTSARLPDRFVPR